LMTFFTTDAGPVPAAAASRTIARASRTAKAAPVASKSKDSSKRKHEQEAPASHKDFVSFEG
jgi:hypothetical protein